MLSSQPTHKEAGTELERSLPVERLDEHFPQLRDELGDRAIYLIRADMNPAGTFKWRGALRATEREVSRGATRLSTASAGNHARGLMVAARHHDLSIDIVVPETAPPQKSSGLYRFWDELGGDESDMVLTRHGQTFDESYHYAQMRSLSSQTSFIHPFDDVDVIAGQGEHLGDVMAVLPTVTRTVSATGGGGLAAGLQAANASMGTPVVTHFVEASGSNSLSRTLRAGSIEPLEATHPNMRYGGTAVSYAGKEVVRSLWRNLYDHRNMVTAYDEGIRELACMYETADDSVVRLEPTALIAVEGIRQLLLERRLADDDVVAVLATGHNESPASLLRDRSTALDCINGYTIHTPPSKR